MDLALDTSVAEGVNYKPQRSRIITETWAENNLYCLNCVVDSIEPHLPGQAVEDFFCPSCDRRIQLEASRGGHGRRVANSAYDAKMEAIEANSAPDYAFMGFDPAFGASPTSSTSRDTSWRQRSSKSAIR